MLITPETLNELEATCRNGKTFDLVDSFGGSDVIMALISAVRDGRLAVETEREECVKICEHRAAQADFHALDGGAACRSAAQDIRNRASKPQDKTEIDYRQLLWKYMNHVGSEEGVTFRPPVGTHFGMTITEDEARELKVIESMRSYQSV